MFKTIQGPFQKHLFKCSVIFLILFTGARTVMAQVDSVKTQTMAPVDMAGTMRSNGKIYVVVAVLVIILAGLFTYLTRLDRKITRLEKGTWKDT